MKKRRIYTIGHSTHPVDAFIALLQAHGIQEVVDVRTVPKSRHNPQFNAEALKAFLREAGIRYTHEKKLGGLRHTTKDSLNIGWRNASFKGILVYPGSKLRFDSKEGSYRENHGITLGATSD